MRSCECICTRLRICLFVVVVMVVVVVSVIVMTLLLLALEFFLLRAFATHVNEMHLVPVAVSPFFFVIFQRSPNFTQ